MKELRFLNYITINKNLNNSLFFYKHINDLDHFKDVWVKPNILKNYIHAFYILFKRTYIAVDLRRKKLNNQIDYNGVETILYINSNNTYHSLEFLSKTKNTLLLEQSNRFGIFNSDRKTKVFYFTGGLLLFISMITNFIFYGLTYWKNIFLYPNLFFENWGKDIENYIFLSKFKNLKRVVFSNDHNVENRMFKLASEELGIKTVYLQHATITRLFPKLDFDQSFLFGEVDLKKYKQIGSISGEINLVGSPKFDALYTYRKENTGFKVLKTIGLAVNKIDKTNKINDLINIILKKTSFNIILRLHPGEERNIEITNDRVNVHHANTMEITNFFDNIDFLLAGESSIHLESIYLHTPSSYVNLSGNEISDNYEFIKYNLLEVFDLSNISNKYIENLAFNFISPKLVKKFLASYNSDYDGKVGELVKNKIFKL